MTNEQSSSMYDLERQIESSLRQMLPDHLLSSLPELARVLASASSGRSVPISSPEHVEALHILQNRVLPTTSGTIKVGSIAGEGIAVGHGASVTVLKLAIHTTEQAYDVRGLDNPYLGLRSFTYDERHRFAGRDRLINAARQWLVGTPGDEHPLLLVAGASGSGKSSFAQAGIIPMLEQYYQQRHLTTRRAVFTPRTYPLASLRDGLQQLGLPAYELDLEQLVHDPSMLFAFIEQRTPPNQRNLIVLDQLEEVFTLTAVAEQRDAIVDILTTLPPVERIRTHIIVTVRADYREEISPYKALHERYLQVGQRIDVQAMDEQELQDAMHRPIQSVHRDAGKALEPALLQRLTREAQGDSTYLPLLQVTLEELWRGGRLTLAAYGDTTLATAIQRRADNVLKYRDHDGARSQERSAERQQAMLAIFTDLVKVPLDDEEIDIGRVVRRRLRFDEVSKGSQERQFLIDELSRARLLAKDTQRTTDDEYVEVTIIHDALIREWGTLRNRIAAYANELRRVERFRVALQEWVNSGKKPEYLLIGGRLKEAEELDRDDVTVLHNPDARALLDASIKKRRRDATTRVVVSVLLMMLIIGIGGASWAALQQQQRAAQEAIERERQQQIAEGVAVMANAQNLLAEGKHPDLALALSIAAVRMPFPDPQAKTVLYEAAYGIGTVRRFNKYQSWADVAYSPDEQYIAFVSRGGIVNDGIVRIWDVSSGEELYQFDSGSAVRSIAFSPDGNFILSGSVDGIARLWDLASRSVVQRYSVGDVVIDVDFDAIGESFLTLSSQGLSLWDTDTGLETRAPIPIEEDMQDSIEYSPDGRYAILSSYSDLQVLDMLSGNVISDIRASSLGPIYDISFHPDGTKFVTGGCQSDRQPCPTPLLTIYSFPDGMIQSEAIVSGVDSSFYGVSFSPDGRYIAARSSNSLRIFNQRLQEVRVLEDLQVGRDIIFSYDGNNILTSDENGPIIIHVNPDEVVIPFTIPDSRSQTDVVFSSDGAYALRMACSGFPCSPDVLGIFDVDTGKLLHELRYPGDDFTGWVGGAAVKGMSFSRDGRYVASIWMNGAIVIWDIQNRASPVVRFTEYSDNSGLVFNMDGTMLGFASDVSDDATRNAEVIVWDIANGREVGRYSGAEGFINSIAISPDSRFIVAGSDDSIIRMWDIANGQAVSQFVGHTDAVNSVAISLDGQYVLSGSSDRTVRVWEIATGREIQLLIGHEDIVREVSFNMNGQYILSGSADRTLRVWERSTGHELHRFVGHEAVIVGVGFSADGKTVLSGTINGTLRQRHFHTPDELLVWACNNRYVPELTTEQRQQYGVPENLELCPEK